MYKWQIDVTIKSNSSKLSEVISTSHKDAVIKISDSQDSAQISLKQEEVPTKDFVLIYRDQTMYEPDYKLVQHSTDKETIVASINFFPDFNTLSLP